MYTQIISSSKYDRNLPEMWQKNINIFLLSLCIYTGFIVIESKSSTQSQCHEVWYFKKLFGSLLRCIHYDIKDAYPFLEENEAPFQNAF